MKKVVTSLFLIYFSSQANIEINNDSWIKDYELLVNLNTNPNTTISGLDLNKNGIRDDVEYYVEQKYKDKPFQKELFLEASKKIQEILSLPKSASIKKRIELDSELISIYTCRDYMLYKLDVKDIEQELKDKMIFKSRVLNTNKRLRAYIEHKKLLPLDEENIDDMDVEKERLSCEKRYEEITNRDIASSK
jgi:hypothetical protein